MSLFPGMMGAALRGLKRAERLWLRPFAQLVRVPRQRRAARGGLAPETEELLVAVLRERVRDRGGLASDRDVVAGTVLPHDVDALVRGLLDVPPRGAAPEVTPLSEALPLSDARPRRRAA